MARATVDALQRLRRPEEVARTRGLPISRVLPYRAPAAEEEAEPTPSRAGAEPNGTRAEAVAEAPAAEEAPAEDAAGSRGRRLSPSDARAAEPAAEEPAAATEEETGGEA